MNRILRHTALTALGLFACTVFCFAKPGNTASDFALGRNTEILVNMMRELSLHYVDELDADSLMLDAADGMVTHLDRYTEFMPEEQMSEFDLLTTGKYGGVGSVIRKKGDYILFAQPQQGAPADRAGVRVSDKILAIDGRAAKGWEASRVSGALKGAPGTSVEVVVEHLVGGIDTIAITRERIALPSIPYSGFVAPGIAYIRHSEFTEGSADEMRRRIEELQAQGSLRGLILDYRSNGGGILQEAIKIVSLFTPKGTEVVRTKGREASMERVYRTSGAPLLPDTPLIVLQNSSSASASEIVAGALQDHKRATVIGQTSFGKGVVQSTRPLGYNTLLKLTTAKYYLPSGRNVQDSKGVTPDIVLDPEYISRFTATLIAMGLVDDYVDEWVVRNADTPAAPFDLRTFTITDENYAAFGAFLADKEIPYESQTRRALEALRRAAENDKYDHLTSCIDDVEATLKDDLETNLETYKRELTDAINSDIILRYAYQAGVMERNLLTDPDTKHAIEVLSLRPSMRSTNASTSGGTNE